MPRYMGPSTTTCRPSWASSASARGSRPWPRRDAWASPERRHPGGTGQPGSSDKPGSAATCGSSSAVATRPRGSQSAVTMNVAAMIAAMM
jgi:hypothetical protein